MPDERPGRPGPPDRARLAARALAQAKADARARGERRPADAGPAAAPEAGDGGDGGGPLDGEAARAPGPAGPRAAGAARPRRDDPQPLRAAVEGLVAQRGWQTAAAVGSVFGRWAAIVGPELAAHTRPESFESGQLAVVADSTAWATQLRILAPALVRRLNEELGHGTVTRVAVRGPVPPRRAGPRRVRGARGPRGDYG